MELTVQVKKKQFADKKTGELKQYYELTAELFGETVKIKLDKEKNELFKYLLAKCDIPLEKDNRKEELMHKLFDGEALSDEEKAELKDLIDGEEG